MRGPGRDNFHIDEVISTRAELQEVSLCLSERDMVSAEDAIRVVLLGKVMLPPANLTNIILASEGSIARAGTSEKVYRYNFLNCLPNIQRGVARILTSDQLSTAGWAKHVAKRKTPSPDVDGARALLDASKRTRSSACVIAPRWRHGLHRWARGAVSRIPVEEYYLQASARRLSAP
jgi:hypothetical protein